MLCGKRLKIIFATSVYAKNNRFIIGYQGRMPWQGQAPSDMERFRSLTRQEGKNSVIIGRKTWESIPEKFRPFDKNEPLAKSRQTLIITRKIDLVVNDPRVAIVNSLEEAVKAAKSSTVWIAGGAKIYKLALPYADCICQTSVSERFEGDTFFPDYDQDEWVKIDCDFRNAGRVSSLNDQFDTFYEVFERKG